MVSLHFGSNSEIIIANHVVFMTVPWYFLHNCSLTRRNLMNELDTVKKSNQRTHTKS